MKTINLKKKTKISILYIINKWANLNIFNTAMLGMNTALRILTLLVYLLEMGVSAVRSLTAWDLAQTLQGWEIKTKIEWLLQLLIFDESKVVYTILKGLTSIGPQVLEPNQ